LGDGSVAAWRDITDVNKRKSGCGCSNLCCHARCCSSLRRRPLTSWIHPACVNEVASLHGLATSPEEVLGKSSGLLHGPDWRGSSFRIRAALQARQPVEAELIITVRRSEFWVEISITPVAEDLGGRTHPCSDSTRHGTATESEREQLLTREQAATPQLEAANRAKDDFFVNGFTRAAQTLKVPYRLRYGSCYTPVKWCSLPAPETTERSAAASSTDDLLDIHALLQASSASVSTRWPCIGHWAAYDTVRLVAEAKAIQTSRYLGP